jgi:uncharacterized protein YjbI with pentapeptide repeats
MVETDSHIQRREATLSSRSFRFPRPPSTSSPATSAALRTPLVRMPSSSPQQPFWPGISLDLTGATLVDFNFEQVSVIQAQFVGATFQGVALFREVTFQGLALFREATFQGAAGFNEATFQHLARRQPPCIQVSRLSWSTAWWKSGPVRATRRPREVG